MGGGAVGQRGDLSSAPAFRRLSSSLATPAGLSRLAWAAGSRSSSAVTCRPRPPRSCPAAGHAGRVVEAGVGGGSRASRAVTCWSAPASRRLSSSRPRRAGCRGGCGRRVPAGQRGDLLAAPAFRRLSSSLATSAGLSRGGVGGGPVGQRGDLLPPASYSLPSSLSTTYGSSIGCGRRPAWPAAVTCRSAPASRRLSSSLATPCGLSRLVWAAGSRARAVTCRPRPPSAGCPAVGHADRVVEAGVGGGPVRPGR